MVDWIIPYIQLTTVHMGMNPYMYGVCIAILTPYVVREQIYLCYAWKYMYFYHTCMEYTGAKHGI